MGMDIGPKTAELWTEVLLNAKTICWNGPAGVFEFPQFESGSLAILKATIAATEKGATSIVGGGDTAAFTLSKPDLA